uniref:Uncharacterized protein n=1 Tax=Ciona intestinalis TaxID=7719 RepID=H2XSY7_CIOIN
GRLFIYFLACAFSTLTTIFCSSTRKARTILSRTAFELKHPPYALVTCFFRLHMDISSFGRAGLIPNNCLLVSPHFGMEPTFLVWRYTKRPPKFN